MPDLPADTEAFVEDGYYDHIPDKTCTVYESDVSFTVTYRNEQGKRFRCKFKQKPNPIGFHVRLPGDAPRR